MLSHLKIQRIGWIQWLCFQKFKRLCAKRPTRLNVNWLSGSASSSRRSAAGRSAALVRPSSRSSRFRISSIPRPTICSAKPTMTITMSIRTTRRCKTSMSISASCPKRSRRSSSRRSIPTSRTKTDPSPIHDKKHPARSCGMFFIAVRRLCDAPSRSAAAYLL